MSSTRALACSGSLRPALGLGGIDLPETAARLVLCIQERGQSLDQGDDWRAILQLLSDAEAIRAAAAAEESAPATGSWLGADRGATPDELDALQRHLGHRLPADYLAFLTASNCFGHDTDLGLTYYPCEQVERLAEARPAELEIWASDDDGDDEGIGDRLNDAILIGDDDALLLLIPPDPSTGARWTAWRVAAWLPGIDEHPSFRALIGSQLTAG